MAVRPDSPVRRLAAALALAAGTAVDTVWAQAVQPGGRIDIRERNLRQNVRRVFPDEAVSARDALVRVRELERDGNLGEAARVLQRAIDSEGEQVLPVEDDPLLHVSVRSIAHDLLAQSDALRARYETEEEPAAKALLDAGDLRSLERARLFTPSGFEGALRLAQAEMESARFHSARRILESLDKHPARAGQAARRAATLADQLARFFDHEGLRTLSDRWAREAGISRGDAAAIAAPELARQRGRSPLEQQKSAEWEGVAASPLQSTAFTPPADIADDGPRAGDFGVVDTPSATPWVFPVAAGSLTYVNDGAAVSALDSATLAQVWRTVPGRAQTSIRPRVAGDFMYPGALGRFAEDVATVAVARGVVVAPTGIAVSGGRRGDSRVHAVDAATGRVLWSLEPQFLDPRLAGASVRGAPFIEADTAVLAVRRPGLARRVTTLYLVGVDLYSGALRWLRPVGSVGAQPWGRSQERVEGGVLADGVVYRGDDMGIIGAFDATSGRPLWVRLTTPAREADPNQPVATSEGAQPHEILTPIVTDDSVFYIEPGVGAAVRLDRATGARLGSRSGSEVGNARYMIRVGGFIAFIGRTGVSAVPIDGFDKAPARQIATFTDASPVGRVASVGGMLALPLEGKVVMVDPSDPSRTQTHALDRTGNLLVVGAESEAGSLLVADASGLHTFLSWDRAEAGLRRLVEGTPADPAPILTYLELALRKGRAPLAPALADKALALIAKDPAAPAYAQARTRLFALLHGVLRDARTGVADGRPETPVLTALEERLARAAETPEERVIALIERAYLRGSEGNAREGADALQEILLDETLADAAITVETLGERRGDLPVTASAWDLTGAEGGDTIAARDVATRALRALLETSGVGAYETYEQEASGLLAAIPADAPASRFAALARSYPFASAAPLAWLRAAEALGGADGPGALRAAHEGVLASVALVRAGRAGGEAAAASLARAVVELASRPTDGPPAARALLLLAEAYPGLAVPAPSGTLTLEQLQARAAGAPRATPSIAGVVAPRVQVIEGWEPVESLVPRRGAHDCQMMASNDGRAVALFAASPADGRLAPVWQRRGRTEPTVISLETARTLLLWQGQDGTVVEAVSNAGGRTLWKSREFSTLPGLTEPAADAPDRVNTPLDGIVRADDLLMGMSGSALVLSERRGRAAAFSPSDGSVLWAGDLGLSAVYDLEIAGDLAVVVGATTPATGARPAPAVLGVDASTGHVRWRVNAAALSDHARWARALPDGGVLLGINDGLLRVRAEDGGVAWAAGAKDTGIAAPIAAWGVGHAALVLDQDFQLWRVDTADGSASREPVLNDRVSLPFNVDPLGDRAAVTSSQGVVILDAGGRVVGTDAMDSPGRLEPARPFDGGLLTIESGQRDQLPGGDRMTGARIIRLDAGTARITSEQRVLLYGAPSSLSLLDNKVLVGQKPFTLVYTFEPGATPAP